MKISKLDDLCKYDFDYVIMKYSERDSYYDIFVELDHKLIVIVIENDFVHTIELGHTMTILRLIDDYLTAGWTPVSETILKDVNYSERLRDILSKITKAFIKELKYIKLECNEI